MLGIAEPRPFAVEPMRPIFRMIVYPESRSPRAEKVDMVAQGQEAAAQQFADFIKDIVEVGGLSGLGEIAGNMLRRIENGHRLAAPERRASSRSRARALAPHAAPIPGRAHHQDAMEIFQ